ncbi:DUF4214 domain-containing protein [Aestuariibius sp. 2305UL40-4]|uniref:DUF4214 domain-containing protein n=1 Tax=Aestuariibius violaceus TaxID=3234132 RepID=UPI00345EEEF4
MKLIHHGTWAGDSAASMAGLSDLLVRDNGTGLQVYSTGRGDGGVRALEISPDFSLLDADLGNPPSGHPAPLQLHMIDINGTPALLTTGRADGIVEGRWIEPDGSLGNRFDLTMADGASTPIASHFVTTGGNTYMIASSRDADSLSVWRLDGQTLDPVDQTIAASAFDSNDVFALDSAEIGGRTIIVIAEAGTPALTTFALGPDGELEPLYRINQEDGLFFNTATEIELVDINGQTFALVGASGAISVVALNTDGSMTVTDQINDDQTTRFAGHGPLETITVDGQIYVAAGGSDDGVTLFTLLPNGRLVHVATQEDTLDTALADPTALDLGLTGGPSDRSLQLFIAGEAESSLSEGGMAITHLEADLGQIGIVEIRASTGGTVQGTAGRDQILGGDGRDTLYGNDGDDILLDGAGEDTLIGGNGADLFVLSADGQTDRIEDFEAGVDRIDLSQLGLAYILRGLEITETTTGAELRLGDERLLIESADGRSLTAEDFNLEDLRDLDHVIAAPLDPTDQTVSGTADGELLDGGSGNDRLEGRGGTDVLLGDDGNDLLIAESIDPAFDSETAAIFRLYQGILGRRPDVDGLIHWFDKLESGELDLSDIAARFVASAEFQRVYGATSSEEFITLLYNNVLGRNPDPSGLAHWVRHLDSGPTRSEVALGFSESQEFVDKTETLSLTVSESALQAAGSDEIFRLYRATLNREPDLGGFETWTKRLADGMGYEEAAGRFVASAEFQRRYGETTDTEFITLLYRNVLEREPDAEGLATWLGRLDAGMPRAEAVGALARSAEFVNRTEPDLIDWMRSHGMDDVLHGGAGENVLSGGLGVDKFNFSAATAGSHTVVELEAWDVLSFTDFGYGSADDVRANMEQSGKDLHFSDAGVTIVFLNTSIDIVNDDMIML